MVRDNLERKPINMNFIVGSGTTFQFKNPQFNVMHVDKKTWLPVDLETHYFDIDHANKNDDPRWGLFNDYRTYWKLKDLSPGSFLELGESFLMNSTLAA